MSATYDTTHHTRYAETAIQKVALIVGIVFLVVGVAGFIPGLSTDLETLRFSGPESEVLLVGIFQVSILHNIVHLLYGIVGVALAASAPASRNYLIWGGAVYLLLWIFGLFVAGDSQANFVPVNTADNWLHLVFGVGMILLGVFVGRARRVTALRA
jgi:Domain of unknown function (DUF4383)